MTNLRRLVLIVCLALAGCRSIGPGTVVRDRFEYSSSISESWKRQTLLNIVKLRYLDPPIFVDVGQIVAGYTFETGANLGGQLSNPRDYSMSLGAYGKYTDRPTVTYTPLTGNQFIKAIMTPLLPESVFFMIQSGWPADGVLLSAVASINGLKNQETSISGVRAPDAEFLRAAELFRALQQAGTVSMRVKLDQHKHTTSILTFHPTDLDEVTLAKIHELRQLLRLDRDATEFTLVFGGMSSSNKEIAVLTRSILHIMSTMAAQVEVPVVDITEKRAAPGFDQDSRPKQTHSLVRIQSSKARPTDAFVTVAYRNRWFWVDDRDLGSKRTFALMLMLFTLTDTGQKEPLPLITIPAQ